MTYHTMYRAETVLSREGPRAEGTEIVAQDRQKKNTFSFVSRETKVVWFVSGYVKPTNPMHDN